MKTSGERVPTSSGPPRTRRLWGAGLWGACLWAALLLAAALAGCGGDDDDGGDATPEPDAVADTGEEPIPELPVRAPCQAPSTEVAAIAEQIGSGGEPVHYTRFVPEGCTAQSPCPGLFLVPDGLMGGDEMFGTSLPRRLAALTGAVVIVFNPPGRGIAAQRSGGEESYNGRPAQDALRSVFMSAKIRQDTSEVTGVISFGSGLSIAAWALSRYGETAMAEADFLIDIEGPLNRCGLTHHPLDAGLGITTDGPGGSGTACAFNQVPREDAFPTLGDVSPAVLCSPNAPLIAASGKPCTESTWWTDREPANAFSKLQVEYLRVQMLYDHRAPTRWASLLAIYYAVQASGVGHHQLNNVTANTALLALGDSGPGSCEAQGCYLQLPGLGNSFVMQQCTEFGCEEPFNPYHAEDPEYRPMDFETFFTCVLPTFVNRMLQRAR